MDIEIIKHKTELIKTKAELERLLVEYEPDMSLEDRDECRKIIKEIDKMLSSNELKRDYKLGVFNNVSEAKAFIRGMQEEGYKIQISNATTSIAILAEKIILK